jgi:pectate lyase
LEELAKTKSPGWIVFSSELGPKFTITLKAPLRPTDNITIDGRCADVTLETTEKLGLIYIFGTRNIIISNLAFRKSDYVAGRPDADVEGCIRLNAEFDAVAILHNDLERCSDGVIDTTISPKKPIPKAARVTVAFNFIREHDKAMLFGTFGCVDASETFAQGCKAPAVGGPAPLPALYLTLEGNIFYRTGQRHPRAYGRVYAHIANNLILFEPQKKVISKQGADQYGSGYGTFVSNGAQALIERNVYLALGRNSHPSAVWTTTSPGADKMAEDVAGAIRLSGNLANERALLADNMPEQVADPIYRGNWSGPSPAGRSIAEATACIAARAGRGGLNHWPAKLCGSP